MSITNVWYAFTNFDLTWYHVRIISKNNNEKTSPYAKFPGHVLVLFSRLMQRPRKLQTDTHTHTQAHYTKSRQFRCHTHKKCLRVQIKIIVCTNRHCSSSSSNERKNPKFKMFSNTFIASSFHIVAFCWVSSNSQFMCIIMSDKR